MSAEEGQSQHLFVAARCRRTESPFVLKLVRGSEGYWRASRAIHRGSDEDPEVHQESTIEGPLAVGTSYEGCPHCGDPTILQCGACDRIACRDDGFHLIIRCPHCRAFLAPFTSKIREFEAGRDY